MHIYISLSLSAVAPTLEHTSSEKCFVSLQFLNLRHSVGLLGRRISPSQGRYLYKHRINTNIRALSGIRTHDPSVRAGEDSSCLRDCSAHVCPHGEEVHARKWKLYAATQDTALDRAATVIGTRDTYRLFVMCSVPSGTDWFRCIDSVISIDTSYFWGPKLNPFLSRVALNFMLYKLDISRKTNWIPNGAFMLVSSIGSKNLE
jgi:hypothetical protein